MDRFYYQRAIPSVLRDALTYDEMFARLNYEVEQLKAAKTGGAGIPVFIGLELSGSLRDITVSGQYFYGGKLRTTDAYITIPESISDNYHYLNLTPESGEWRISDVFSPAGEISLVGFPTQDGYIINDIVSFIDPYTGMHNEDPEAHPRLVSKISDLSGDVSRIDQDINNLGTTVVQNTSGISDLKRRVNAAEHEIDTNAGGVAENSADIAILKRDGLPLTVKTLTASITDGSRVTLSGGSASAFLIGGAVTLAGQQRHVLNINAFVPYTDAVTKILRIEIPDFTPILDNDSNLPVMLFDTKTQLASTESVTPIWDGDGKVLEFTPALFGNNDAGPMQGVIII